MGESPDMASEQLRLRRRIARDFQLVDDTVRIASIALPFHRVADPDRVLDDICAQEEQSRAGVKPRRELRMPYWAAVWESAAGVGQFLDRHRALVAGKRCLDLGCGMGLAGMVLAELGGIVTLCDIETAALLFASLNTLPWRDRCTIRRIDWQTDRLRERFDLIVGSDILYERAQWEHIEPFLRHHLTPGGVVLLGEPGRPQAEEFPQFIRQRGWALNATTLVEATSGKRIHILRLALDG